ncbi:ESPR domain-containing protein, partial [Stenotrophomonas sp. HMWF023]|uniref:ESPR domain-containing protein n=1 Tax=Stenotrophomonas sp. HMWF023 TaxID=2056859 RepID=UPI002159C9C9
MNRIYRRVWNRQLNALVVASELATGDSGGTAPRDRRASLLVPSTLALALLCVLASGPAAATESSQSLRDLQALAAKYTQPMPVKVDAEVALAAAARQAQANPAISANARVGLQLSTTSLPVVRDVLPATVQVKLAAGATPNHVPAPALAADVRANIGVGNAAATRVDAALAANVAPAAQAPLGLSANAAAKANVGIAGTPVASVDAGSHVATAVSATPSGLKAAVDGKVDSQLVVAGNHIEGQGQAGATAAVALPAKEELPGDTDDRAITAAFDAGVAGRVRVQGKDGEELVADRNLKLAGTATVAAQNSALGLGGLLNGVGTALNGVGNAVGSLLNGDLSGTVNNLGGAVGGLVGNTLGSLGLTSPSAIPPTSPKAPAAADPNAGLVIGTGGLVGGV